MQRPAPEPAEPTEMVIDPTSGITASEPDVSETSTTEGVTESLPCGKRQGDRKLSLSWTVMIQKSVSGRTNS